MAQIKIAIINSSTLLTDEQIIPVVAALQRQVHEHFAPAWGIDADLTAIPKGHLSPPGMWWIALMDNSDQAGALGYHDLTPEGLPIGKVFAATDLANGYKWSITASHEVLEMLADPDINDCIQATPKSFYANEVADPVEADNLGYEIDGVWVSDFIYRTWFQTFRKAGSTQFDYMKHLTKPLQLAPGGYISILSIRGGGWKQIYGEKVGRLSRTERFNARPKIGSRRERRSIDRDEWVLSEVKG